MTTHIPVALRCLESGFRAVFVEQPLATDPRGIDELRASASGRVVMVGCALRFAFDLPRYSWSLLELFSCKPASHWLSRAAVRIRSKRVSLEVVYPEIDLAYGANGRIHRITCLRNDRVMRLSIEHQNMSHSEVQIDETGLHDDQRYLTVTAYDDGEGLRVLHQPLQQVAAAVDQMYAAEMKHFLDCIEQGVSPCNTIEDAAHVLFWALQTARAS